MGVGSNAIPQEQPLEHNRLSVKESEHRNVLEQSVGLKDGR